MLSQGQSHPTRGNPISQPTNNISVTGDLAGETFNRASDLIDLRKTDNTFEFGID